MSNVSYYTPEGLKKLKEELNQLRDIERPKASQAIAEARDKGDLSENAEYDAAKEAQGLLEMKIAKMEELLALCDRILVMHRGRIAAEFPREAASKNAVLAAAMGQSESAGTGEGDVA